MHPESDQHRSSDPADPPRVTVLGSINLDLIVRSHHLPAPGETTLGTGFTTAQGGKGANQAIAAARAGAEVTFIGAIGSDDFGSQLSAALTREGVGTGQLRTVAGPSGIAVITVDDHAENTIVVAAGANGELNTLSDDDKRLDPPRPISCSCNLKSRSRPSPMPPKSLLRQVFRYCSTHHRCSRCPPNCSPPRTFW